MLDLFLWFVWNFLLTGEIMVILLLLKINFHVQTDRRLLLDCLFPRYAFKTFAFKMFSLKMFPSVALFIVYFYWQKQSTISYLQFSVSQCHKNTKLQVWLSQLKGPGNFCSALVTLFIICTSLWPKLCHNLPSSRGINGMGFAFWILSHAILIFSHDLLILRGFLG